MAGTARPSASSRPLRSPAGHGPALLAPLVEIKPTRTRPRRPALRRQARRRRQPTRALPLPPPPRPVPLAPPTWEVRKVAAGLVGGAEQSPAVRLLPAACERCRACPHCPPLSPAAALPPGLPFSRQADYHTYVPRIVVRWRRAAQGGAGRRGAGQGSRKQDRMRSSAVIASRAPRQHQHPTLPPVCRCLEATATWAPACASRAWPWGPP